MKTKLIAMFALVLCMSAFLLPMTAFAATESVPPTIKAWIDGELLLIEATDSDSGVEAVFINDERVNYRVDGGLALSVSEYGDEGDTLSIYAIDFAGNKSEVVTVDIPIRVWLLLIAFTVSLLKSMAAILETSAAGIPPISGLASAAQPVKLHS